MRVDLHPEQQDAQAQDHQQDGLGAHRLVPTVVLNVQGWRFFGRRPDRGYFEFADVPARLAEQPGLKDAELVLPSPDIELVGRTAVWSERR